VVGGGGPMFARRYAHAGMVRLDGEKMSKSLGNLVFVSALRSAGVDPMAIRLAILAHHYRQDWDWTAAGLTAATDRLSRWRRAVALAAGGPADPGGSGGSAGPGGAASLGGAAGPSVSGEAVPEAGQVLAAVRDRMADGLDAPGALAVVDSWADAVLADAVLADWGSGAPAASLVRDTVDALLGVAL
jgi:L-cysteine:1D-myo-inositol 2-amino-2-deoxy-alpha-D-glucopyranoside ligase